MYTEFLLPAKNPWLTLMTQFTLTPSCYFKAHDVLELNPGAPLNMGDTDRFSLSFALNTSSRLLWGSMAFARRATDLDMAWQFFLCISSHWMLLSDLSFFSSDILKEKAKGRDNLDTFISNLSDWLLWKVKVS